MYFVRSLIATAVLSASIVTAIPASLAAIGAQRRQVDSSSSSSPCANISDAYQQYVDANTTGNFYVDGQLAYDCLNTMPFDAEKASAFIQEVSKYLQFQSTIPVLLNPPSSYLSPAVDLLGGLNDIFQKANSSNYTSQYEMDTDLNNLWSSANDGHLSAQFCSLSIFSFSQEYVFTSVSEDGNALPKIYALHDAELMFNGSTDVSDLVQINGENATEYLLKLGLSQSNQDPDAQWNDLFFSQAKKNSQQNYLGSFADNSGLWMGSPSLNLTFTNGSTTVSQVTASVPRSGFNYTDGQSLFETFCLPANTTSGNSTVGNSTATTNNEAAATSSVAPTATAGPIGYPDPLVRDPYNTISGYYLDGEEFSDVAVMFIPTFVTSDEPGVPDWEEASFAAVASEFVNQAVADNKTRMVIDVSGNPGGTILSGFDLFKLFFPDMDVYSASRYRDHPAARLIAKSYSDLDPNENPDLFDENPFNYADVVTPNQTTAFTSWEELAGPYDIQGANMSALIANFNFSDVSTDAKPIRGYGGVPLNVTGRPFEPENIVVISDGFCQSTCTTFVNLMTSPDFGNVSSIAFGGRALNSPMQTIGGVRGAQSATWSTVFYYSSNAITHAYNETNTTNPILSDAELAIFEEVAPINTEAFPLVIGDSNLNLRNAYNPGDDETPLQFTYQPANCRLFYTVENILDPSSTWTAAARTMWGNGTCVEGSVPTNSTSTGGALSLFRS